jgi:hypothetical protein
MPHERPVAYPGESVTILGRWSLAYQDPPGVHGHGTASGGWDPDNGVVTFTPPPGPTSTPNYWFDGLANQGDCTLTAAEHSWCSAVLDNLLRLAQSGAEAV